MTLRLPHLLPFFAVIVAGGALAAEPSPQATSPTNPLGGKPADAKSAPGQPRVISWGKNLVPKDWDPMKELKGMDLSKLDDSDPRDNEMLMKLQERVGRRRRPTPP